LREELGAEWAQDLSLITRLPLHKQQGSLVLGHRALPQYLAGKEEITPFSRHQPARLSKHKYMTVDAGIHVAAVTVLGRAHYQQVGLGDVQNSQGDARCLRSLLCPLRPEKGGDKRDPDYLYLLCEDDPGCQDAVEPAGDEPHR